jgi:phosphatidylglycerophosphatase A
VNWKLWIAQGFGIGRIPVAPGTFGSVLGIAFFAALLCSHSWSAVIVGTLIAIALSVWLCGEAEQILGKRDPGSVVLDEVVAMPCCYVASLLVAHWLGKGLPQANPEIVWNWWTLVIFVLFRIFDVWKPTPVRQSQRLSGGWGVTVDDLLAAAYVNLTVLAYAVVVFVLAGHSGR